MKRILLTIAYDGTNYSGWQKQKDEAVITVEGELTKALRLLFRNPALECVGASRTDAGVHALGQRAVIDVETLEDVLTEGEMEEKILERIALREAIAQLTDREQMVIRLRYFHGLTQDKTAKILGVSQVQISRIEKKALAALRQHI